MPTAQDPDLLRRLLRARDRMDAASHEDWPVERLARVSGVSPAHFARSFKAAYGVPPHRYLLTRRLERAAAMLRDTSWPVTEIALAAGWSSLGSFSRTFRDVTGVSPSAYRARQPTLPAPGSSRAESSRAESSRAESPSAQSPSAHVPVCFARAAQRPDLRIAVLEKRRRATAGTTSSPPEEDP